MDHVSISSHADLQALQDRSDGDGRMSLKLVSLESVHIAGDSYALLCNLMERRCWRCPQIQMDLLSLVVGMALELHKIKHDLFPLLVVQKEGYMKTLLLLRNSTDTLISLAKDAKKIDEECVGSLAEKDVLVKVKDLGVIVGEFAGQVMNGNRNFAWLQGIVPGLLEVVDAALLSTPVYFPDPK